MTPGLQARVFEVHPEVAFWAMNGERALDEPKKVKSRPYGPGLARRRELLAAAGYDLGVIASFRLRTSEGGEDDVLDALACSWTAARIARGVARRFPAEPPVDGQGLRMEIWG
jgi:predicted RNase H-like nuclease